MMLSGPKGLGRGRVSSLLGLLVSLEGQSVHRVKRHVYMCVCLCVCACVCLHVHGVFLSS